MWTQTTLLWQPPGQYRVRPSLRLVVLVLLAPSLSTQALKWCDWIACEVECNLYGPKWNRNWSWLRGGEVFTIQRSPSFVINDFFSAGHGDVQAAFSDDWLKLKVTPDGFEYENDEVLIYGNSEALTFDLPYGMGLLGR